MNGLRHSVWVMTMSTLEKKNLQLTRMIPTTHCMMIIMMMMMNLWHQIKDDDDDRRRHHHPNHPPRSDNNGVITAMPIRVACSMGSASIVANV
jgi:choline-glycine betaine transporter